MGLLDVIVDVAARAEIEAGVRPPDYVPVVTPVSDVPLGALLAPTEDVPRFYPFGFLPGGLIATGGIEDPHKIGYVREIEEGELAGGLLPADVAADEDVPIKPGDIDPVVYLPGEVIIVDRPGSTYFAEREIMRTQIDWHERIIEIPGLPGFEWPDIFGGLKDIGKYALIGGALLIGIMMMKGK